MRFAFTLLVFLFISSYPAHASFETGNQFLSTCELDKTLELACVAHVSGFVEGVEFEGARMWEYALLVSGTTEETRARLDKMKNSELDKYLYLLQSSYQNTIALWCRPNGSTKKQLFDVVISYIRDNPSERHLSSTALIIVALTKSFPCER